MRFYDRSRTAWMRLVEFRLMKCGLHRFQTTLQTNSRPKDFQVLIRNEPADSLLFAHPQIWNNLPGKNRTKGTIIMARYISLIQFTDQGIRNIKDTVKRGDTAMAEAEKMGLKIVEEFWTMGAYDVVVLFDAPDDETVSAFILKIGSLGNVKGQTMRAFHRQEMEGILAKIK